MVLWCKSTVHMAMREESSASSTDVLFGLYSEYHILPLFHKKVLVICLF